MAASSSTTARRLVAAAAALAPAVAAPPVPVPTKPRMTLLDFAVDRAEIDVGPPAFPAEPPVPWTGDAKALTRATINEDVDAFEPDAADSVYTHLLGKQYAMATVPEAESCDGPSTRPYLLCVLDEKTGECCTSLVAVLSEQAYVASTELEVDLGRRHFDVVGARVRSRGGRPPAFTVYAVLSKASRVPWDDAVHPRLVAEARERYAAAVEAGEWVPVEESPLAAGADEDVDACSSCGLNDDDSAHHCEVHTDDLLCLKCYKKDHSECVKVSQKHDKKRAPAKAAAPAGEDVHASPKKKPKRTRSPSPSPSKKKKAKPAGKAPKKSPRQAVKDKDSCADCEDEYATQICDEHQIAVCDECYDSKHNDGDCGPDEAKCSGCGVVNDTVAEAGICDLHNAMLCTKCGNVEVDGCIQCDKAKPAKVVCDQCDINKGALTACSCGVSFCEACERYHAECRGEEITH